jgi:hypothetical protein
MKFLPIVLAVLVTFAGGTAASASTTDPPTHPYTTRLLRAVDTCEAKVTPDTTFRQVVACVRGIAAPQPNNTAEVDIWRSVLDCLWLGWTPGRGDGGFDNGVVNSCLEDQGIL